MNIEELKKAIEEKTGIPAALIQGSTEDECFNYARQIAAFKGGAALNATARTEGRTTREQFADYLADIGLAEPRQQKKFVDSVESAINEIKPSYPEIRDAGEVPSPPPPPKTARDSFAEFFNGVFAFDPTRHIW